MIQHILNLGKVLTKTEQRYIYGSFGEECEPLLGTCTSDDQCHPVHNGLQAYCEFGCCVTPI